MPSVQYYNRTAPFWDFVANLEDQGSSHPLFAAAANRGEGSDNENEPRSPWTPWNEGWAGFPWGSLPHRGRHDRGHRLRRDGPPPPPAEGEANPEAGPSDGEVPPPPFTEKPDEGGPHGRRHHGRHGPHGARGGSCRRGRGWGGRERGAFHPYGFGPFGPIADMFQNQLFGESTNKEGGSSDDFKPEADVFDTPDAFVVHLSLAGAKKEDVGVNWDADKSELSIAGVIYRPGDEEFLKTLAMDERRVGAFERKVRLGSRANPAQVDVDGITAKMEDGVLRIEVPKLDSGYVEIKKVDIE